MIILLLALTDEEQQKIGEYVELYSNDLYNFAYRLTLKKSDEDVLVKIERRDTKLAILSKINKLPQKHREPILMFYYQAMKYDDIAKVLSIPVGTVRSRINTAKRMLKKQMERESYV